MAFKLGNLAADAGKRRSQLPASGRQAPLVDDREQDLHCVETIHKRTIRQ
jgi:hypothetical protein